MSIDGTHKSDETVKPKRSHHKKKPGQAYAPMDENVDTSLNEAATSFKPKKAKAKKTAPKAASKKTAPKSPAKKPAPAKEKPPVAIAKATIGRPTEIQDKRRLTLDLTDELVNMMAKDAAQYARGKGSGMSPLVRSILIAHYEAKGKKIKYKG